ncbi:hypothetical protein BKA69DRAFT_897449 [Paraphysoderma sedebokerense]|nr:hypothetical protein BKA69DRAFT_897449 [Paraphysoderma sedebokerense]
MTYNKYNPYVHQTLNTLEKMSIICSILVLAFGLPFRIDDFKLGYYRTGLVVIILSVIFGFILSVFAAALSDVMKSIAKNTNALRRWSKRITTPLEPS